MSQHFHPEFGYFHPVPRLRRDSRVALASFACGAALGVAAIVAVNMTYREGDNVSAAEAVHAPTASVETTVSRPATAAQQAPHNGALIARVPLGRPEALDQAKLVAADAETSAASQPLEAPRIPPPPAEVSPKPSNLAGALQQKNTRKITGGPNLLHKEASGGRSGALAAREEVAPHAPGSAYARGRTVFWNWSR
jgi:hypothetical protein